MKKFLGHPQILAVCALASVASCQSVLAKSTQSSSDAVAAQNRFAFNLYARLIGQPGNIAFSPFSIGTILAISHEGANGETAAQIADVLHLPKDNHTVHNGYGMLLSELRSRSIRGANVEIANGVFVQQGYSILKTFEEILRDNYDADLHQMDLTGWPNNFDPNKAEAARKQISVWASERIRTKIPSILSPSLPDLNTRLILINAISFKGKWATPFTKGATAESLFRLDGGQKIPVQTMRQTAEFHYADNSQLQVLEMPYVSDRFSLIVLLPRSGFKLDDLERSLVEGRLERLLRKVKKNKVQIYLPRFRVQSSFDLRSALQAMGMVDAFDVRANFSGITIDKPFFIQAAVHATWIEVDEEGTEAVAASTMVTGTSSAADQAVTFNANHPYLFLIRDTQTDLILFLGRVADPSRT